MDKLQRQRRNFERPTHMKPDEVEFAREIADALTVVLQELNYWKEKADMSRGAIEWEDQEKKLMERVEKFLNGKQKR